MDDHATWLLSQLSLSPTISINDPLEEGSYMQKFYTYAVSYEGYENPVGSGSSRHRYSDFEKLQATLRHRYQTHGILVPSLPKKNVLLKGQSFHNQRMRGLTIFCEKVSASPYFRNDDSWSAFLTGNPSFATSNASVLPPCNPRWEQAVLATETPSNCNELLAKFKSESSQVENTLVGLISKSSKLVGALGGLSTAVAELAVVAGDLAELETNEIENLNTLTDGDAKSSVPNVLSRVSTLLTSNTTPLSELPEALNMLLVESLEYEAMQLFDFTLMLKHVDKLVGDNDKFEKAEFSLERKNLSKLTEDKIAKHEEALKEAGLMLAAGKKHLDFYIRSICMVTLPTIAAERKVRMKAVMMLFAACCKAVASGAVGTLETFFAANEETDAGWLEKGSVILVKLGMPAVASGSNPPAPPQSS